MSSRSRHPPCPVLLDRREVERSGSQHGAFASDARAGNAAPYEDRELDAFDEVYTDTPTVHNYYYQKLVKNQSCTMPLARAGYSYVQGVAPGGLYVALLNPRSDIERVYFTTNVVWKDPDTQRLPNFKKVMSNVEKMGAILSDYAPLDAALDRYQAAKDEKEQTDTYAETRRLLADYRSSIAKNPLLQQIDANPYVSVKVLETLATSLEAIGKLLKG